MENQVYIYVLIDPIEYTVRYIGMTAYFEDRRKRHCSTYQKGNTHRANWLRKLNNSGLSPIMLVVEECIKSTYREKETWWIAYGKACGWNLTNATLGGEGVFGFKHSEETKRKYSENRKGKKQPESVRVRLSFLKRKENLSPETRQRKSNAQKGSKNPVAVLTEEDVSSMRWLNTQPIKKKYIGRLYGISYRHFRYIITGKIWNDK